MDTKTKRILELDSMKKRELLALFDQEIRPHLIFTKHSVSKWTRQDLISSLIDHEFPS